MNGNFSIKDSGSRTIHHLGHVNKNGDKRGCCGTHGGSGTILYSRWCDMKRRCYNPKNKRYINYGARGIKVCDEWKDDFEAFYDWSMSHGYEEHLTIDRIDVNGNYEPSNCRWATAKEQQRNTSRNHFITAFGETKTIAEWAEQNGLSQDLIKDRINKLHWNTEKAVSLKPLKATEKKGVYR